MNLCRLRQEVMSNRAGMRLTDQKKDQYGTVYMLASSRTDSIELVMTVTNSVKYANEPQS